MVLSQSAQPLRIDCHQNAPGTTPKHNAEIGVNGR
jgi:hypothetical protein